MASTNIEKWAIDGVQHVVGIRNVYVNDKGNLVIETTTDLGNTTQGNINIESMKNIQIKPGEVDGGSGDVRIYSDHTGSDTQAVLKFLCGTDTAKAAVAAKNGTRDDKVIRGKFILAELELNNKGAIDDGDFADDEFQVKVKNDDDWIDEIQKAKAHDIRCMGNGGIAIQPSGSDSSNHTNKIKFEHSMKVPIEHFAEYTIGTTTTYNYAAYTWVCLGQLVSANGACQILEKKVLSKKLASWNDDMEVLSDGEFGIKVNGMEFAVGYNSTNSTTGVTVGSIAGTAASDMDGKYIFVKRLAVTGYESSSMDAVQVALSSGTNKYIAFAGTGTPITVSPSATGTAAASTVLTRSSDDQQFSVNNGSVDIDLMTYTIDTTNNKVTATGASTSYTIASNKFSITPIRGIHYASEGGMGIEFGTFNPMHASLYCGDYRFKGDAPIYGVTRGVVEQKSSGKVDYPTQDDDFKDILSEDSCTWNEIIAAVKYLKGQNLI